eukprot:CAMPEP_0177644642 /NCGR_PEP_ID=MMETSP0447-20121125/8799_1 /TAXON_ID=0 /ORGANISM="Stygamoeba regulata, Strain BSH-02190019" /LENGTH=1447 /DNA_ID=CAMNT_0019147021 /DNA_START=201 /DNA_END=4544 /DNA_ORIENTATION=+
MGTSSSKGSGNGSKYSIQGGEDKPLLHASAHFSNVLDDDSNSENEYGHIRASRASGPTWAATTTSRVTSEERYFDEDEDEPQQGLPEFANASSSGDGALRSSNNQDMPLIMAYDKDGSQVMKRPLTLPELVQENRRQFPDWMRTARPATVLVENVTFSVKIGPKRYRTLLEDVSFSVKPRQMVLLLGSPGAGKTTLFRLLSNQLPSGRLEGSFLYNAKQPDPRKFHRLVSYVTQDDIHMPAYTVGQTFEFAARCQMPENTPEHKIQERVNTVLELLGLSHRRDTIVGNDLLRGISGGEKKRVTIGIEFTKGPGLYLLDEPSTGLDAKTAIDIFKSVRIIADMGPPVICTLKQPSVELFNLFDKLMIMSQGKLCFFGDRDKALDYFESLGYRCPDTTNPADFFQELIDMPDQYAIPEQEWSEICASRQTPMVRPITAEGFVDAYQQSEFAEQARTDIQELSTTDSHKSFMSRKVDKDSADYFGQYPQPLHIQTKIERAFAFVRRTPKNMIFRIVKSVIMALYIGSMFFNAPPHHYQSDLRSIQGLVFNVIAFIAFATLASMPQVLMERQVFYLQRTNRYYSTFPYFIAGICVELPVCACESIIYGSIVYWMAGLNPLFERYIFYLLVNFLLTLAMNAYCRFCACASRNFQGANAAAPAGIALTLLFSGYIIQANNIPPWFIWIYWISPLRYAYEALSLNELVGETYTCRSTELVPPTDNPLFDEPFPVGYGGEQACPITEGSAALDLLDFPTTLSDRWYYLLALFGFFVFFQAASYFALRWIRFKPLLTSEPKTDSGVGNEYGAEDRDGYQQILMADEDEADLEEVKGAYLSFHDLGYIVKDDKKNDLPLLTNISGYVKPGMLLALMGPSGAGKTTLMDVIANKKTGGKITGDLKFNGLPRDNYFHRFTGYVEQQDIHMSTQTVEEALDFAALTRLPPEWTREEKLAHARETLHMLELDVIRDRQIGTVADGLAAEERKRVTIGVELAANPTLLFLDEPTSGLDAMGAMNVMRCVQKAASSGRTIICTIHQPSAKIFSFFTHLLLLKRGGEMVYFGDLGENFSTLLEYFGRHGYQCPRRKNPADYILELTGAGVDTGPVGGEDLPEPADMWRESREAEAMEEILRQGITPPGFHPPVFDRRYACGILDQVKLTLIRAAQAHWRRKGILILKVARNVVIGLLLGLLFFQLSDGQVAAQETVGLIFFSVLFANLGALSSIPGIFEDRAVFYRERGAGCYYSFSYLISVVFSDFPVNILQALSFSVCMYFLVGMNLGTNGGPFFFFVVNYFGALMASLSLCQLGAALSPSAEIANAVSAMIVTLFSLAAGFLLTKNNIPDYWIWLYYISFVRYPLESLTINQVLPQTYTCGNITTGDYSGVLVKVTTTIDGHDVFEGMKGYCPINSGQDILNIFDMNADNLWLDFGVVFAYWAILIVATWAALQFVKNVKR